MNQDENQDMEEGLQENVALESSLENNKHMYSNPRLQGSVQSDSTAERLRDTVNQHKVGLPQLGIPTNYSEEQIEAQTEESQMDQAAVAAQQIANKAAGTALSAATGGAIPPQLAGKVVEAASKRRTLSQKILEFFNFSKKITNNPILSKIIVNACISLAGSALVLFIAITLAGVGKRKKANIIFNLALGTLKSGPALVLYLIDGGWCKDEITCPQSSAYYFFTTLDDKLSEKVAALNEKNAEIGCQGQVVLTQETTALLTATLFFYRSDDELLSSNRVNYAKYLKYEQEMDFLIDSIFALAEVEEDDDEDEENSTTENDQNTETENDSESEDDEDSEEDDDEDEDEDDEKETKLCYVTSQESFHLAIIRDKTGYIDYYRKDLVERFRRNPSEEILKKETKEQLYLDILKEANLEGFNNDSSGGSGTIQGGYGQLSGITVTNPSGDVVGTYTLEEYVAGVVAGEMYDHFPLESKKALAVAARTYVLSRTNYGAKPIESSSKFQNFSTNISESDRAAAKATEGQILVDSSGKIFAPEYDSWNCKGQNTCTYMKEPNRETHVVTISDKYLKYAAGGHGRGMSQIAAADMAANGAGYKEILKFFYSDGVQISTLTKIEGAGLNSADSTGFRQRISQPTRTGVGKEFYFTDLNKSYKYGYLGQCTWYAYGRANEILSNAGSSLKWGIASNAGTWYQENLNRGTNGFASSADYTKPKVGAIVVWRNPGKAGHVGIVEAVNSDGTVTISEANVSTAKSASNPYGWQSRVRTLDYVRAHSTYIFVGYIYLLR